MIIRTSNIFQEFLDNILPYSKARGWATSSPRPCANAPFHDNQCSLHTAILDILMPALTMCSVLSAWDLKIHCRMHLFSRCGCLCVLWDCSFRFVVLYCACCIGNEIFCLVCATLIFMIGMQLVTKWGSKLKQI